MTRCLITLLLAPLLHAVTPNIVLIYADDLGYGDLGCYGATSIPTPHIDSLAASGVRFMDAYATSATCTPSRYGLLTGNYPWRKKGTGILPGDAPMIIPPGSTTLPSMLQKAGYHTAVIGKWHLGLGTAEEPVDWNGEIKAGPGQVGFDYHFIMAATGDRVPTVYLENNRVVNLDKADPIRVSYKDKVGNWPTGHDNPEQRKFGADKQHSDTITNGVSRIGYMTGGKAALWKDEELGDHFTAKALEYIEQRKEKPFFLFFALHEPHVPRVPAPRHVGKTALGPRGDVIAQLDDHVGKVMDKLKQLNLLENTIVIVTSDNGPVLNDGYEDEAALKNGVHRPTGPFSGGKYSKLEAGCRVPLIVSWPGGKVRPRVSHAMVSQIDFLASFGSLVGQKEEGLDSSVYLGSMLGRTSTGRPWVIQEGMAGLAIRAGEWKFIPPHNGISKFKDIRSGNSSSPQLYNLTDDPMEMRNLAARMPEKVKEMQALLDKAVGGK
jgi:arylsulfatase A-like enzyme